MAVDVSIILVSWNTRDLLLACLESLPAAIGDLRADVWVVDNASRDDSVAAVRSRYAHVRLIENRTNLGFAAANNQAIRGGAGRYVLLLNSDTVAAPDSIELLVRFADDHPRVGAVGGQLLNADGSFQASRARFPSLWSETLNVTGLGRRLYGPWYPGYGPRHSRHPCRADVLPGACMLVRRAAIEQVGPMDEDYFMYSEETDWCLRLHRAGWELWYLPDARILHHGGQSTQQAREPMIAALYRSKVRFFRKHYGPLHAALLQLIFVLVLRAKWIAQRHTGRMRRPIGWRDLSAPVTHHHQPSLIDGRS
ncbi:glycosyltransferase family 2 protein [Kallotenue papyrolyticum]|uniref:glycosyltransferase family 2 protein n=1 Tax=Kallotenue papyrolyticum TaxID=1325125 RepID=UPI00047855C7|nr:glycosyltransferase family 2 protein [Kallotenue papyrolyticum]